MDISSEGSINPLEDAILNWIGTFKNELGEDFELDSFVQLYDGVVLYKMVRQLTSVHLGPDRD